MASWVMGTGIHFEKPKPQMPLLMTMIMMMWWPNTLEKMTVCTWLCAIRKYKTFQCNESTASFLKLEILSPKFTKQCFLCCYGFSGKRGIQAECAREQKYAAVLTLALFCHDCRASAQVVLDISVIVKNTHRNWWREKLNRESKRKQ